MPYAAMAVAPFALGRWVNTVVSGGSPSIVGVYDPRTAGIFTTNTTTLQFWNDARGPNGFGPQLSGSIVASNHSASQAYPTYNPGTFIVAASGTSATTQYLQSVSAISALDTSTNGNTILAVYSAAPKSSSIIANISDGGLQVRNFEAWVGTSGRIATAGKASQAVSNYTPNINTTIMSAHFLSASNDFTDVPTDGHFTHTTDTKQAAGNNFLTLFTFWPGGNNNNGSFMMGFVAVLNHQLNGQELSGSFQYSQASYGAIGVA